MQFKPEQLKRQQMIMQALGFYSGKIDGIWSQKSIEAKRAWELSGKFNPAYPNNGLPFGDADPVPKGMRFDKVTRMFTHTALTQTMIEDISDKAKPAPEPVVAETQENKEVPAVEVGSPVVEKTVQQHTQNKHHQHQRR